MFETQIIDLKHRLARELQRLPRTERLRALEHLLALVGDIDGYMTLQGRPYAAEAIDGFGRGLLRRLRVAAASDDHRTIDSALRSAEGIARELREEVRAIRMMREIEEAQGRTRR